MTSKSDGREAAQRIKNSFKITNGLFKTDKNKSFWGRTWEFTSRFTWEGLQNFGGYVYSQGRNLGGKVDRVDFFAGATYATKENSDDHMGITLGNYINMDITDEITGGFKDYALNDPMFMHEYGHTIDSKIFGISYLFAIGIPSAKSIKNSEFITEWDGEEAYNPHKLTTHKVFWTEMRANRKAASYFEKHYGVKWEGDDFKHYPLRTPNFSPPPVIWFK